MTTDWWGSPLLMIACMGVCRDFVIQALPKAIALDDQRTIPSPISG
jgi:hypothetical protein